MPAQKTPVERLQTLFHQRLCWTLAQLAKKLGYALLSVRPFLKQVGYFRSYTDNGKWYTLRATPQFDRDGLWHYKKIGFSKHVSLTASEVAQKLQHPCHTVLTRLHQAEQLDRVKIAGQFRYLSKEAKLNGQQRQQALLLQGAAPSSSLSTQAAVWVL